MLLAISGIINIVYLEFYNIGIESCIVLLQQLTLSIFYIANSTHKREILMENLMDMSFLTEENRITLIGILKI